MQQPCRVSQQVPWSDQKRIEDISRIREAIAKGVSALTEQEVEYIKQQMALLGEDGEAGVGRVMGRAKELACQPADVLKMVEDYLKDLGNRVMLRALSSELEKG